MRRAAHAFSGLVLAIEGEDARTFRGLDMRGKIVEIDPIALRGNGWNNNRIRQYVSDLKNMGATPQVYLVGGHLQSGRDNLNDPRFQTGPTGNWRWDGNERRIHNITSPASMERIRQGVADAFSLGIPLIRIDNLHNPGGAAAPRTAAQLKQFADMVHREEDQARARGSIQPNEVAGFTAHNNHVEWEKLVNSGALQRLPVWLTSEKTPQQTGDYSGDQRAKAGTLTPADIPEIAAAQRMAGRFNLPYAIVDARSMDDAARRGSTYQLPQSYVQALQRLPNVSEVTVLNGESNYSSRNVANRSLSSFRPTLGDTRNYTAGVPVAPLPMMTSQAPVREPVHATPAQPRVQQAHGQQMLQIMPQRVTPPA